MFAVSLSKIGNKVKPISKEFYYFNNILNPIEEIRSKLVNSVEYIINLRLGTILLFRLLYY